MCEIFYFCFLSRREEECEKEMWEWGESFKVFFIFYFFIFHFLLFFIFFIKDMLESHVGEVLKKKQQNFVCVKLHLCSYFLFIFSFN